MTQTAIADLNTLAPYPTESNQQTPAALAKHLAMSAFRRVCELPRMLEEWEAAGLPRTGPLRDAYVYACSAIAAEYGLICMLRREAGQRDEGEDPIVAQVYQPYDGWFESVDSDLTVWLQEYGIDPETVIRAVEAERAEVLA